MAVNLTADIDSSIQVDYARYAKQARKRKAVRVSCFAIARSSYG